MVGEKARGGWDSLEKVFFFLNKKGKERRKMTIKQRKFI